MKPWGELDLLGVSAAVLVGLGQALLAVAAAMALARYRAAP